MRDHVGKSIPDLINELESSRTQLLTAGGMIERVLRSESSFTSVESANDLINRVLQNHKSEVDMVASGAWDEQWLEDRIGSPTGTEATPDSKLHIFTRPTYKVGVLIIHDFRVPRGYRVKTAYPLNDDAGNLVPRLGR